MKTTMTGAFPRPTFGQRVAAMAAAVTATGTIAAALLMSFQRAGPETWLAPTPDVMEAAAACETYDSRTARDHCKQALVSQRVAALKRPTQVAQR